MTLQNILSVLQDWAGIAALPLAALALGLNFLRYRASVAEKLPDISILNPTLEESIWGNFVKVCFEIKNRSDKNLYLLQVKVIGLPDVKVNNGFKQDAYGEVSGPKGFTETEFQITRRAYPRGSAIDSYGNGGKDHTGGELYFQTKKRTGRFKLEFVYAFSSEDEKKYRKTFDRTIPSIIPKKKSDTLVLTT
ncbi:hypothetical protein A8B75_11685 [Sphingomonadales bacterium EhC05]|nr:hypothetical protein A8B75_11685 [Sphingomonadales bacterium EhC05]